MTTNVNCPFCKSPMQFSVSSRYAEWVCTNTPCQGHADIPLAWWEDIDGVPEELDHVRMVYKLVIERARRAERLIDAARMVIGPLSKHEALLAATEDVCRQLQQSRETLAESSLESNACPAGLGCARIFGGPNSTVSAATVSHPFTPLDDSLYCDLCGYESDNKLHGCLTCGYDMNDKRHADHPVHHPSIDMTHANNFDLWKKDNGW